MELYFALKITKMGSSLKGIVKRDLKTCMTGRILHYFVLDSNDVTYKTQPYFFLCVFETTLRYYSQEAFLGRIQCPAGFGENLPECRCRQNNYGMDNNNPGVRRSQRGQ